MRKTIKNWSDYKYYKKSNPFLDSNMESFLFLNGEQRYLDLLKNQPYIFDRIPLYYIASYLGIERESLSRLRKKIARK